MTEVAGSVTAHRDLRTGQTVWSVYRTPALDSTRLRASRRADVVVVGAGVTGAFVAEAATAAGLSVVILDRRKPGHGSTAASTALLQFEIDTPLLRLAEQIGFERAKRAWVRSFRAVQDLGFLVSRLQLACDFRHRAALYLAGNRLNPSELAEEGHLRRSIGLPAELLSEGQLRERGIRRAAALGSHGSADVNPTRLTVQLLKRALDRNCRLYVPVRLAEVVPSSTKVAMVTDDGVELEAGALVYATGYELAEGVPSNGHRLTSTWAFSTPPQPERTWGQGEVMWEASDPYLYARSTADGRVIVGGEDESIDDSARRDALLPQKLHVLQGKLADLLPDIDVTAEFAWAGTFGESATGLPSIGAVPDMPNCYAVLGYGGNGLTFGMLAGQIIGALLVGQQGPDQDIFSFAC